MTEQIEAAREKEYYVVGKPLHRIDGFIKATGQAQFTEDLILPGMLYGKILRSPYPHARIIHIDTSKAERLRGVESVITGRDTLGIKYGWLDNTNLNGETRKYVEKVLQTYKKKRKEKSGDSRIAMTGN